MLLSNGKLQTLFREMILVRPIEAAFHTFAPVSPSARIKCLLISLTTDHYSLPSERERRSQYAISLRVNSGFLV